jgi:hypothetical protein
METKTITNIVVATDTGDSANIDIRLDAEGVYLGCGTLARFPPDPSPDPHRRVSYRMWFMARALNAAADLLLRDPRRMEDFEREAGRLLLATGSSESGRAPGDGRAPRVGLYDS